MEEEQRRRVGQIDGRQRQLRPVARQEEQCGGEPAAADARRPSLLDADARNDLLQFGHVRIELRLFVPQLEFSDEDGHAQETVDGRVIFISTARR